MSFFNRCKQTHGRYPAGYKTIFRLTAFALAVCAVLVGCHTEVPDVNTDSSSAPTTVPTQTAPPVTTQPQPTETDPPETTAPKPTETEPPEPTVPEDFVIPDGIPDVVTYTTELEDLPADYTPEQAEADGCIISTEGNACCNEIYWLRFTQAYSRGVVAKVRFVDFCSSGEIKRVYEVVGSEYGFLYRRLENGEVTERLYQLLIREFNFDAEYEDFNIYKLYALSDEYASEWMTDQSVPNDDTTWDRDMVMVFCELIKAWENPQVPEKLQKATITYNGEVIATVWNYDTLAEIRSIVANAEYFHGEPKTYFTGPVLTLTGTDGTVITADMDRYSSILIIDKAFYNYDPGWKGATNLEYLLSLFGITGAPPWEQQE